MVSGITSGFFSSLSLPSYSRLPTLLILGPGEATLTVVLWWTSFLLFLLPQTTRTINITTQLPIKIAPPMPMAIEIKGLSEKLERGRSTTLKFKTKLNEIKLKKKKISWVLFKKEKGSLYSSCQNNFLHTHTRDTPKSFCLPFSPVGCLSGIRNMATCTTVGSERPFVLNAKTEAK